MSLKDKYGNLALVAGGSEGLGAAFSNYLAINGLDLVLVARRMEKLERTATEIRAVHGVAVTCISCDLADANACQRLKNQLKDKEIGLLVYNAAIPYIGRFEEDSEEHIRQIAQANMTTAMQLIHVFGREMLLRKRGGIVMMSSLAGFQGSGFLSAYAASKAFNRVLAEGLWYEWKDRGVDIIGCCAGATATPNYINSNPQKTSFFAPPVQQPEVVVKECFQKLGKRPSFVAGRGNKIATFIMQRLLPRKMAVKIMGDAAKDMYGF